MYGLDNLARKTFGTVTLLSRTLDRLAAAEKQLTSSKMATSLQLLDVQNELREGRAVLAEYYSKLFDHILERARAEIAEHKRDFKRVAQAHERLRVSRSTNFIAKLMIFATTIERWRTAFRRVTSMWRR
jgi:iron-sulfur cluster repair protein YtfE (RIC family)